MSLFNAVLVSALLSVIIKWLRNQKLNYPPGPPAAPIIGNILQAPNTGAWYVFTEWIKSYGDLVFLHGLGNKILVINDLQFINELFEKRWNNYSDRPIFTVAGELMGLDKCSAPIMPYGHEWREHRKIMHLAVNSRAIQKYRSIQEDIAALLNGDLLNAPDQFFEHLYLASGRIVLAVTYGIFAEDVKNPYIANAEECMKILGKALSPGAYLADLIPIMKYLPSWIPFQKEAQEAKKMFQKNAELPYLYVKKSIAEGTTHQSFASDLLSLNSENTSLDFEHRAMWATSVMYGAGAETTFATSATFILAMALNQEVQKRAQAEIDRIVGVDRIPTISDASELPYTMAVIKETMRWHPPVPLSIPRRTTQDDTFNGYFIPKNTVVIPNLWAISRQVENPEQFNPDRFLNKENLESVPDPSEWVFGAGRRICPGRYLAENSLITIITGILSVFDILPPEDQNIDPQFTTDFISYPKKFKCRIRPRSHEKEQLIKARISEVKLT
ncbi:hypothetical protein VKT23_012290 [Stygiomarasmius scandens]|uniref:Cytochrome P450 n=1 Tax=Marasmiellus scandens TaxID=2682957 RepID=A0ABR1J793_9AGAR